jgi:hypothetical protein
MLTYAVYMLQLFDGLVRDSGSGVQDELLECIDVTGKHGRPELGSRSCWQSGTD